MTVIGFAAGLPRTMVSVDVPPLVITAGLNDLEMVGAAAVVPVADALVVLKDKPCVCPL